MKITRAQKDAVIELLKEKFDEKQKESDKKFFEEHKKEIEKNVKSFLEKQEAVKEHLEAARKILYSLKNPKIGEPLTNIELAYNWNYYEDVSVIREKSKKELMNKIKTPEIETPDYYKVQRQLELDSLSKDFDLDAFLEKYLEN